MKTKLLTISIAAYNVEKYIRNTLTSIMNENFIDDLEVLVIDDGGDDDTISIAKEFEEKYPQSIRVIHKLSGGYGSTVNYSIKNASGKFFKLLDGDDWFDTEVLEDFIKFLRKCESDVVVLPYYRVTSKTQTLELDIKEVANIEHPNDLLKINGWIGMHGLCYKTLILKNSGMILPEHTPYTDTIYSVVPFKDIQTVATYDRPLYCYRLGDSGQSVSMSSMKKNLPKLIKIADYLLCFCSSQKDNSNYKYIVNYVAKNTNVVERILMITGGSKESFIQFENHIKNTNEDVFKEMSKNGKMGILISVFRRVNYLGYRLVQRIVCQ